MSKYTEGLMNDGAAILDDGVPISITEILARLNGIEENSNHILERCALLAETLKEDRFGKLPQFQVADAIREMKVEK